MKRFVVVTGLFCLGFSFLSANNDTFSKTRLNDFSDEFTLEQKNILNQAGLTSSANENSSTITPTSSPIPPAPIAGMLPVVITNTTGLPADQVYVILAGQQVAAGTQFFFALTPDTGVLSPITATSTTYSPDYSYLLSNFPTSTTRTNDYLAYIPSLNGARFYFSIKHPIYLQSDTPNAIQAPNYFAFYDPNYSNLFESIEITFIPSGGGAPPAIPWTASVNTTEVDAFSLPIRIGYFSFDPSNPNAVIPMTQDPNALPSGFGVGGLSGSTTRGGVLTSVITGLQSGDLSGSSVWSRLAVPFYSDPYAGTGLQTYLRILSPKQGLGNNAAPVNPGGLTNQHIGSVNGTGTTTFRNYNYPPFPLDYFTGGYNAPVSFSNSLFSAYIGATNLYLSTGGTTPTVYQGVTTGSAGSYTLTFTGISGPNTGAVNTLLQTNLNTFHMYSGSQALTGAGPEGTNIGFYFGDSFTVGVLPSAIGTVMATPINITDANPGGWEDTNISNYYLPANAAVTGGPWYSLYAKELHKVAVRNSSTTFLNNYGLCYAYDFDDSLGISGTITPVITTQDSLNPYLGITLGAIDTPIPDPYSDTNSYDVTFNVIAPSTLSYQQGNGPVTPVTSGVPINSLVSNSSNPLRIFYTNAQGSSEFIVYLYYQFLVPQSKYSAPEISVINSTAITPNNATPTAFVIDLLP